MVDLPPRWALLSRVARKVPGGYYVTVLTDTPVHLWARWSANEPWVHLQTAILRGQPTLYVPYFCFDTYADIEQEEAGDTLTHTFHICRLPTASLIWYFFWGRVSSVLSPSHSSIFHQEYLRSHDLILGADQSLNPIAIASFGADAQAAQSIDYDCYHILQRISLPLSRSEFADGNFHCEIRTNDGDHPSETVLGFSIADVSTFSDFPLASWVTFNPGPVAWPVPAPLWIVCYRTDYTYWWSYPHWWGEQDDPYTRGRLMTRSGPDDDWVVPGRDPDCGFIEYGYL